MSLAENFFLRTCNEPRASSNFNIALVVIRDGHCRSGLNQGNEFSSFFMFLLFLFLFFSPPPSPFLL